MEPLNYRMDVKSPFEASLQGMQAGLAVNSAMDKAAEQQRQVELQKQLQTDLSAISQKPNPTAQDFAQISIKYPQMAEHFKNTWSMLNADQQQAKLGQASQVYAALNANQPELAKQILQKQSEAAKNSGNKQEYDSAQALSKIIELNPKSALTSTAIMLSSVLGPEKFIATAAPLAKMPSEIGKTVSETGKNVAEIGNISSQINERSGRLGLDRDKLKTETELKLYELNAKMNPALNMDDGAKKIINESAVASVAANQSANQMLDLAGRIDKQGGGFGVAATASEFIKQATGNQDAMTQMRQEYTRLKNNQALKMLPPGPASDKDIQMAMKGFPPDTADSATMSSFLRGMAKLRNLESVTENAKSEWVNAVGHMGKPRNDIEVDGVKVPAGTTFINFSKKYLTEKAEKALAQQQQQQVKDRSYMKYAGE